MENDPAQPQLSVKELFALLLELPEAERVRILADPNISSATRAEVLSLLGAHRSASAFLADPKITVERLATRFGRDVPDHIGPYHLIDRIGEGGFGSVYLAEQEAPIKRRVAIKLIRAGADSAQVTARFEAERDALALMDHPNVARVLDAGTTPNGLPFFVMELVVGKSITSYCDEKRLSTRQRLALFRDVCAAVQHAHQKGVIHRDLKPSNVMVAEMDGTPTVKVIDFGVAKALHGSLRPALTLDRQFIGTPEYMSPEQAAGASDIDTRSDVYGLGVLLYELITGSPPFDPKELRHRALDEIFRLIREVDPPRPSTRIASSLGSIELARSRGTDPARLKTMLQSELDWIVMCCLAKERGRRYESAAALSQDVERFLAGQAIEAHPPTRAYRLQKFARRYRVALVVSGVVMASLVAGLALALYGLREARHQRDVAESARRRETEARIVAQQSSSFLRDMFGSIDPEMAKGRVVSVREVLDEGALKVDGAFPDQPTAEAAVRDVFAWAYLRIGEEARSQTQFARAETLLNVTGESPDARALHDPIRLSVLTGAGETLHGLGRVDEAEARLRESVKLHLESLGDSDPATWRARSALANLFLERAKYDEGLALIETLVASIGSTARARGIPVEHFPEWFEARTQQAYATYLVSKPVEAQAMLATLRGDIERSLGKDCVLLTTVMLYQASVEQELNRFGAARAFHEENAAFSARILGADHPRTLYIQKELCLMLASTGDPQAAKERLDALLLLTSRRFGAEHPFTLGVQTDLAILTTTWLRDRAMAVDLYRDLATKWANVFGPDHPNTLGALSNLALNQMELDRLDEAEAILRDVVARLETKYGKTHTETSSSRVIFARSLFRLNRLPEAEAQFRIAYDAVKAEGRIARAYQYSFGFGECLTKMERWTEAEPILEETLASMLAFPKQSRPQMMVMYKHLADCYDHTGKPEKAAEARAQIEKWRATSRPASSSGPSTQSMAR